MMMYKKTLMLQIATMKKVRAWKMKKKNKQKQILVYIQQILKKIIAMKF